MVTVCAFSGVMLYYFDNGVVRDQYAGPILYRYDDEKITNFQGQILYKFRGNEILDFPGRILCRIRPEYQMITDFPGVIKFKYTDDYITDFSGKIIYTLRGRFTPTELKVFTILYLFPDF